MARRKAQKLNTSILKRSTQEAPQTTVTPESEPVAQEPTATPLGADDFWERAKQYQIDTVGSTMGLGLSMKHGELLELEEIADDLGVSRNGIARYFVHRAIQAYRSGLLPVEIEPDPPYVRPRRNKKIKYD